MTSSPNPAVSRSDHHHHHHHHHHHANWAANAPSSVMLSGHGTDQAETTGSSMLNKQSLPAVVVLPLYDSLEAQVFTDMSVPVEVRVAA
jgi:hypothetical protein